MSVRYFLRFIGLGIALLNLCALSELSFARSKAEFPKRPFWQKKPETLRKMEDERAIFVTVETVSPKEKGAPHALQILGAGWVHRPRQLSYARLKEFSEWPKIHPVIKAAQFNAETKRLFLHMEAFKYEAKMILSTSFQSSAKEDVIHFFVEEGTFKGMRAAIRFQDAKSRKTEVALAAQYDYTQLPLPLFFVEFGLEVVFQKIAEKMRTYIETSSASG